MKITKDYLKKLIKEEIAAMDDDDDYKVGDFLEVKIGADGYDYFIDKVTEDDPYKNTKSPDYSFKALVKIVKIAESE